MTTNQFNTGVDRTLGSELLAHGPALARGCTGDDGMQLDVLLQRSLIVEKVTFLILFSHFCIFS